MTPAEFRAALECWQLEVDELNERQVDTPDGAEIIYDIVVAYGECTVCTTLAVLNDRRVLSLAMAVLGVCYDCASRPIHPNVKSFGGTKCRECTLKGGEKAPFSHEFDLDKVRQIVGPAVLRQLIDKCSWDRW